MKRYIAAILAVCALAFALVGCAPAQSVDRDSLKGFWVIEDASSIGFEAALNLDEDPEEGDFAELMLADSFLSGTWATDGKKATITFDSDEESGKSASIFVANDKLTLGAPDGSRLVFKKGNMDSYYAAQDGSGSAQVTESDQDVQVVDEVIEDVKPVTLADTDNVTIQVTGKGTDFTGDPGYRLNVKNKGKKAIFITAEDAFKVGDKQIEAGVGEVIEAGQAVDTFMYFAKDELGGGAEALKNVTGKIIIGDDDSGDEIETLDIKID